MDSLPAVRTLTNTMLIQKLHSMEARQVFHEAPEPHAVSCALENLDADGSGRVLLKEDVGSAAQTSANSVWVGRGERMMAEKSSKCLHQSSGAGENDVREIESSVRTSDPVLQEEFGCRANSKGIVPPWVAGCMTHVLHRSEKHHNVCARSRMRTFRDVLTQDDGTVDPGNERGEMPTVNPVRFTGTSLGRTDANHECPSQNCTASERWPPGVFSSPTSAQEQRKIGVEADDGPQEEVRLKVFHLKEECDVRLPRAQGSSIATRVRTPKEARPCGSDQVGGVC